KRLIYKMFCHIVNREVRSLPSTRRYHPIFRIQETWDERSLGGTNVYTPSPVRASANEARGSGNCPRLRTARGIRRRAAWAAGRRAARRRPTRDRSGRGTDSGGR